MVWTVLEILVYMIAAAVLGVILGWILRGALGSEQAEVSDLRAQLRALKKERRELKAKSMAEKAPQTTSTSVSAAPKKVIPAKSTPKGKVVANNKPQSSAKSKAKAKTTRPKKNKSERETEQASAKKAVIDIVNRVGKGESKDDLTKIHGVGPKFSALLNKMNITSYQQVAKFKKVDIRTISAALGSFSDRIERDDWVGSAKKLLKEAKK